MYLSHIAKLRGTHPEENDFGNEAGSNDLKLFLIDANSSFLTFLLHIRTKFAV